MENNITILKNKIKHIDISEKKKEDIIEIINEINKQASKINFKNKMLKENANASKILFNNIISEIKKKNRTIKEINEELKTTEEELRENNEELIILNEHINKQKQIIEVKELRLQNIIENQGEGFAISDFNDNFIFTNSKTCKIFEIERDELIGKNIKEFLDKDEYTKIKEYTKKKKENISGNYELKIKLKNNTEKYILVTSAPDYNDKGEIVGTIGNLRDITERKKEQERIKLLNNNLKKSEEKYRVLFEKSNDAILLIENNKFIDCNMAAVKMFGYTDRSELLMTHPYKISPKYQDNNQDSFEKAEQMMDIAYKNGLNKFEWKHKRAKGEIFPTEVWLTAIPYTNKQALHTVVRDLTKIKNNEKKLKTQRKKIEIAHNNITDSIFYANKIQQALLPKEKLLKKTFSEYFIFNKPLNIVSGDFYWVKNIKFSKTNDKGIAFVLADCTGHGVPGAFLSMLGISILNEIVRTSAIDNSGLVLDSLRERIKETLGQTGEFHTPKDGMDITFCNINKKTMELSYAGANNSIYIIRKKNNTENEVEKQISILLKNPKIKVHKFIDDKTINTEIKKNNAENYYIIELKPDRQPIGIYLIETPFVNQKIQIQKDDTIFTFSDGYADQFNNKKDKINYKRYRNLILSIADLPLSKQKQVIKKYFYKWKGNIEQIDDILLMAVKI